MPTGRNTTKSTTKTPRYRRGEGSAFYDEARRQCVLEHRIGGKVYRERGGSWSEVEEARDARRAEVAEAARRATSGGDRTVAELLEEWLADEADGAPGTLANYRLTGERLLASAIADTPIAELTVAAVEAVWTSLATRKVRPLARATIEHTRSHLAMAVERAVRLGYVPTNVVRSSRITKRARRARPTAYLDRDGFVAMREYLVELEPSTINRVLLVTLLTGCRPGEVLGLRWGALDLDAGVLHVRSALQRQDDGRRRIVVDELKTDASRRGVQMPSDLVAALRDERRSLRARRMAATEWAEPDLVFASAAGRPLDPANVRRAMRRACADLALPPLTPNGLRHSFASVALDLGLAMPAVARVLGHVNTRMLATTYGHALDELVPTGVVLDAFGAAVGS